MEMTNTVPFESLVEPFRKTRAHLSQSSRKLDAWMFDFWREQGAVTVGDMDRPRYITARAKLIADRKLSPATVNKLLIYSQQFLDFVESMGLIPENVLRKVKRLPNRGTVLTRCLKVPDETKALLIESERQYRIIWATYLCTGLRHSELTYRRVSEIEFHETYSLIHLPAHGTKTRTARDAVLGTRLTAVVRKECEGRRPDAPVFPNAEGRFFKNNLLGRFHRRLERAGINWQVARDCRSTQPTVDIQSLRDTAATVLQNVCGAPDGIVAVFLGHGQSSKNMFHSFYDKPWIELMLPWYQKLEDVMLAGVEL